MTTSQATPSTDAYIQDRVKPRIVWYDRTAVFCKRLFLVSQYLSVLLSISIIVLLEVESVPRSALAAIAALIALVVVTERIGQFGNRWQLYRLVAESLTSELELFRHRAGPYASVAENPDRTLVERTEELLASEAVRWRVILERSGAQARRGLFPTE